MINIASILFYIFSTILLISGALVVTSRNTVHGVLFLILAFFNASGLFILAHAEFLAMMLIIVYVGAVAVLFLFVVMMLNVEVGEVKGVAKRYSLIGGLIGGILAVELILMMMSWTPAPEALQLTTVPYSLDNKMTNTQALGNLLYTHYALVFQAAGLILLIAMVGAVVLTLRHRGGVKKQKIKTQVERQAKDSLQLLDIPSGTGI